jgi:hypothetical protein
LSERAPSGETGLLLSTAHLVLAEPTGLAFAASAHERCDHPVAFAPPGDTGADGDHTSDELVSSDVGTDDVGVRAVPPVIVAATQTDRQDLDDDLAWGRVRVRNVDERDRPLELFVDGGLHSVRSEGQTPREMPAFFSTAGSTPTARQAE